MKILVLLMMAFLFIGTANAQLTHGKRAEIKDAQDKYANIDDAMELPEGTALKNRKVTLNNGYRTAYPDTPDNGFTNETAKLPPFRCGCTSDSGDRRVNFTGNEIDCASGCSMDVTPGNEKHFQSGNEWKKIILSSDNIKRQKAGN